MIYRNDEDRNQIRRERNINQRQYRQSIKDLEWGIKALLVFVFVLLRRDLFVLENNNSAKSKCLHIQERGKGLNNEAWSLSRSALMEPKQRYKGWP